MARPEWEPEREKRIEEEIFVDREGEIVVERYDPWERALCWYYYLQDKLKFPFEAKCIMPPYKVFADESVTLSQFPFEAQRIVQWSPSPLRVGQTARVIGLSDKRQCEQEMFVEVEWRSSTLSVPLIQLEVVSGDEETRTAIEDWHYWLKRGYGF